MIGVSRSGPSSTSLPSWSYGVVRGVTCILALSLQESFTIAALDSAIHNISSPHIFRPSLRLMQIDAVTYVLFPCRRECSLNAPSQSPRRKRWQGPQMSVIFRPMSNAFTQCY